MATTYILRLSDGSARTVSRHRKLECAARKARQIQPHEQGAYLPTTILAVEDGISRYLTETEHERLLECESLLAQGVL